MNFKRLFTFLLIIILLGFLAYFYPQVESLATGRSISPSINANNEKESAYVTKIVDGDTIHVKIIGGDKEEIIRFLGINTPEKNKPEYQEAKDYLINEIQNKTIGLQRDTTDIDKYNRKLRYVFYDDKFINIEIIQKGLATTFMLDDLKYKDKFKVAETFARNNELGMWKKSINICANCIILENLDPKQESFTIKNNCTINCNLDAWIVKDDANHFFELSSMSSGETKTYTSKTEIWNNAGDRFFMRDDKGDLVIFYEY